MSQKFPLEGNEWVDKKERFVHANEDMADFLSLVNEINNLIIIITISSIVIDS